MDNTGPETARLKETIHRLVRLCIVLSGVVLVLCCLLVFGLPEFPESKAKADQKDQLQSDAVVQASVFTGEVWKAPTDSLLLSHSNSKQLQYGKQLIVNTANYFGPKGSVAKISNGMNCQNCHLNAGTAAFGNNFGSVAANYPKYRARSGKVEDVYKRISDCFERSLNGTAPSQESEEMQAMAAYINWVGKDVEKGKKASGGGIYELAFLNRAASPEKGKKLYTEKCRSCHLEDGSGKPNGVGYTYPPLWGENSFNHGAGLYRLSRMAGFLKTNMPLGSTYDKPQLSDEEAWDIAAYVVSLPRPQKDISSDWPKIAEKPVDHPFGPYADAIGELQHKYGPFPLKDR